MSYDQHFQCATWPATVLEACHMTKENTIAHKACHMTKGRSHSKQSMPHDPPLAHTHTGLPQESTPGLKHVFIHLYTSACVCVHQSPVGVQGRIEKDRIQEPWRQLRASPPPRTTLTAPRPTEPLKTGIHHSHHKPENDTTLVGAGLDHKCSAQMVVGVLDFFLTKAMTAMNLQVFAFNSLHVIYHIYILATFFQFQHTLSV